jgi:integrase
VKLSREEKRGRRLNADIDEEDKLLAACNPHLRAVLECALETGMRRGEIVSLQWSQVIGLLVEEPEEEGSPATLTWAARPEILLPAAKTKTRRDRRIPISARLRGVLELRRLDPRGVPLPLDAYVFGNAIGQKVTDIKRAWMTALLKAHGHQPTFTATANLSAESRAVFAAIDLHLHDLRREAGSRWLEGGVPLHTIRDWLGHTSIAQTSTYLAGTIKTQHDAMVCVRGSPFGRATACNRCTNRGAKTATVCHDAGQYAQQRRGLTSPRKTPAVETRAR